MGLSKVSEKSVRGLNFFESLEVVLGDIVGWGSVFCGFYVC